MNFDEFCIIFCHRLKVAQRVSWKVSWWDWLQHVRVYHTTVHVRV